MKLLTDEEFFGQTSYLPEQEKSEQEQPKKGFGIRRSVPDQQQQPQSLSPKPVDQQPEQERQEDQGQRLLSDQEFFGFDPDEPMPVQERSLPGWAGSKLARGVHGAVESGVQALDVVTGGSDITTKAKNALADMPEHMKILRPDVSEVTGEEGFVKRGIGAGIESAPESAAVLPFAWAGAKLGAMTGNPLAAVAGGFLGAGVGLVGLFGLGTFGKQRDVAREQVRKKNPYMSDDEVEQIATKNGLTHAYAEVLGEGAGDFAAAVIFSRIPGGKSAYKGGKKILKELVNPNAIKTIAKGILKDSPFEVGSEMLTSAVQFKADEDAGISQGTMLESMGEAIIPALFLSTGMGVTLGGYSAYQRHKAYQSLNEGSSKERAKAVEKIAGELAQATDKKVAGEWYSGAMAYVEAGQNIPLDINVSELAARNENKEKTGNEGADDFENNVIALQRMNLPTDQLLRLLENPNALKESGLDPNVIKAVVDNREATEAAMAQAGETGPPPGESFPGEEQPSSKGPVSKAAEKGPEPAGISAGATIPGRGGFGNMGRGGSGGTLSGIVSNARLNRYNPDVPETPPSVIEQPSLPTGSQEQVGELPENPPTGSQEPSPQKEPTIRTVDNPDSIVAGQEIETEPSDPQKEAGNYKKPKKRVDGFVATIENEAGSTRTGKDEAGNEWSTEMKNDYGYLRGTKGYDKDHLDAFFSHGYDGGASNVYIVNQYNKDGSFDEHKVVFGVNSEEEALKLYNDNYEKGWNQGKSVVRMNMFDFKRWAKSDRPSEGAVNGKTDADFREEYLRWLEGGKKGEKPAKPSRNDDDLQASLEAKLDVDYNARGQRASGPPLKMTTFETGKGNKRIAVTGDTQKHKTILKALGGRWNRSYKAWTFPESKRGVLESELGDLLSPGDEQLESATPTEKQPAGNASTPPQGEPEKTPAGEDKENESHGNSGNKSDTPIGKNQNGQDVYEDENGVRSYVESGVEITQPVSVVPGGASQKDSLQDLYDKRRTEYLTAEEVEEFQNATRNQSGEEEQAEPALTEPQEETTPEPEPEQEETLSTEDQIKQLSDDDITGLFDEVDQEQGIVREPEPKPEPKPEQKPEKTAADITKEGGIAAIDAVKDAVKGLSELFGDPNTLRSGPAFDEETYRKAKPHFVSAWNNVKNVGYSVKELISYFYEQFGSAIRPYLERFMKDVRDGNLDVVEEEANGNELAEPAENVELPEDHKEQVIAFSDFFHDEFSRNGWDYSSITQARNAVASHFNIKEKDRGEFRKAVDEAIEYAIVKISRQMMITADGANLTYKQTFDRFVQLYESQPRLGTRTSDSVRNQAFSTPAPIAYLVNGAVGMHPGMTSTVFEPTAGTGMLLIGANPNYVVANELDPLRAAILRDQGLSHVMSDDAMNIGTSTPADIIVTNPPFGKVKNEDGTDKVFEIGGFKTTEIDQAIVLKSLENMAEDGRAALIIGGLNKQIPDDERAKRYGARAKKKFFRELYDKYNVIDHFTVAGELYEKQGAGWPIDIIFISGKGQSSKATPDFVAPPIYRTFDELGGQIERIETEEETNFGVDATREQQDAATPVRGPRTVATGNTFLPEDSGGTPTGWQTQQTPDESPGDRAGSEGGSDGTPAADGTPSIRGSRPGSSTEGTGNTIDGREPGTSELAPDRVEGGEGAEGDTGSQGTVRDNDNVSVAGSSGKQGGREVIASEGQAHYAPSSSSGQIGTLTPQNMSKPISEALERLAEKHGSVDNFVQKKLEYKSKKELYEAFSAEQIDAVALALDNLENENGFILGDQTGIGKGRVVASMIRYATLQGKTPVFMTEKQGLYADMYRDMIDIGFEPSIVNDIMQTNNTKIVLHENEENEKESVVLNSPTGWNATLGDQVGMPRVGKHQKKIVFTTYDQLNDQFQPKGIENPAPRRRFLQQLVQNENVILIMDEAHNAGGSGDLYNLKPNRRTGIAPHPRALFLRQIIPETDGVIYSSATYAKNPDVMDLYSATDLRLGVGGDIQGLAEAVGRGGIPFQQITAAMLSESGQYIRRERSFDGVTYSPELTDVNTRIAEDVSRAMSVIRQFEDTVITPLYEGDSDIRVNTAMGESGQQAQNFTSLMHNIIGQMLLSLKVKPAVEKAIKKLQDGTADNEQVVLTVSNTMGAFLDNYVDNKGLMEGDVIEARFNDLLERYLHNTRLYITGERDEKGDLIKYHLTDEELGEAGVQAYEAVRVMINSLDLSELPVSPVDYMLYELKKAGFPALEITGRDFTIDYSEQPPTLSRRDPKDRSVNGKIETIKNYNTGKNRAIVLNRSGSTGISLHASERNPLKGQGKRTMYIVQAEVDINVHMQMLGRIHRTGQVVTPDYVQVVANIPAERKPAALLVAKMASLNANTTADADSLFTDKSTVNFLNKYGDRVAAETMAANPELNTILGSPYKRGENNKPANIANLAKKVTGRLPLLPLAQQDQVYDALVESYNDLIAELDATGRNDLEAKTFDLDAKTIERQEVHPSTGESPFQGAVFAEKVDMKRIGKPFTTQELKDQVEEHQGEGEEEAEAALEAFETYRFESIEAAQKRIDEAETDLARDEAEQAMERLHDKLRQDKSSFDYFNDMFRVGNVIDLDLNMGDGAPALDGVIVGKMQRGNPRNPLALSTWRVRVAVPDGIRVVNLPFSKFGVGSQMQPGRVYASLNRWAELEETAKQFDEALSVSREERWIITGNLFTGYATFRESNGRIMVFTREDGTTEQGVLMPPSFDPQVAIDSTPVAFETADQALEYMRVVGNSIVNLRLPGDLRLVHNANAGQYLVATSKAVSKAGRFFRDDSRLLGITGSFTSLGNNMVTDPLTEKQVRDVFDLFRSRNNTWFANTETAVAREIVYGSSEDNTDAQMSVGEQEISNPADIRAELRKAKGRRVSRELISGSRIKVIPLEQARSMLGSKIKPKTQGFSLDGTIYLIEGRIAKGHVWNTLLHELGSHQHLESVFTGKSWDRIAGMMDRFEGMDNETGEAVRAAKRRIPESTPAESRNKEWVAYYLENNANREQTLWKRIISAIKKALVKMGFSPKMVGFSPDDLVTIATTALRTGRVETAKAGNAFSGLGTEMWYSRLQETIAVKGPKSAPAAQWLSTISSWKKKGTLPEPVQEELEWTGLEEWIKGQDGKVSRDKVIDFLTSNGVQVREVVKRNPAKTRARFEAMDSEQLQQAYKNMFDTDPVEEGITEDDMIESLVMATETPDPFTKSPNAARYHAYQLPGGDRYKELLIILPRRRINPLPRKLSNKDARELIRRGGAVTIERDGIFFKNIVDIGAFESIDFNDVDITLKEYDRPEYAREYTSSHWDESNVLAHIRFNERTGPNGERVLFIEEVQSDWHQGGRKEGYESDNLSAKEQLRRRATEVVNKMKALDGEAVQIRKDHGDFIESYPKDVTDRAREIQQRKDESSRELDDITRELKKSANNPGVPDAPFKKSWPMLTMKRMIRYAAENGFDRIAWASGEQQVNRYDLSKRIDSIHYEKDEDGTYGLIVYGNDFEPIGEQDGMTIEEIEVYLGKEIAQKIENGEGEDRKGAPYRQWKILKGLDLKVGGEGMKSFYDKMLPSQVGKFIKKFGAKVEPVDMSGEKFYFWEVGEGDDLQSTDIWEEDGGWTASLNLGGISFNEWFETKKEAEEYIAAAIEHYEGKAEGAATVDTQLSFPITDKMRDSALGQGVPLFSVAEGIFDEHELESMQAYFAAKRKRKRADMSPLEKVFSSFEYIARRHAAPWKAFQAQVARRDQKHQLEEIMLGDNLDDQGRVVMEGFTTFMQRAKKEFSGDYETAKDYILEADKSGEAYGVKRGYGFKVTGPGGAIVGYFPIEADAYEAIKEYREKSNDNLTMDDFNIENSIEWWEVRGPDGSMIDTKENEADAVDLMIDQESTDLRTDGYSDEAVEIVKRFRVMTNTAFDFMIGDMRRVQEEAEALGLQEPTVEALDESKRWVLFSVDGKVQGEFATENDAKWLRTELAKKDSGRVKLKVGRRTDDQIRKQVSLSEAIAMMGDLRGSYFPRQRKPGAVALMMQNQDGDKIREHFDLYLPDVKYEDIDTGEEKERPFISALRKKFNLATGYIPFVDTMEKRIKELESQGYEVVAIDKDNKMPETVFDVAKLITSVDSMLQQAKENNKEDLSGENQRVALELNKLMTAGVADIFKQRGYLSSRMKRSESYWRGFEEDLLQAGVQYAKGVAGGIAKKEAARKMTAAILGRDVSFADWQEENPEGTIGQYEREVREKRLDPNEQPRLYEETMSWMREVLRNEEQADRILGTIKGLAVMKFLGFRVSSAVVNMTNMLQAVPATISAYGGGKLHSSLDAVRNAAVQYGKYRTGQGRLSNEDRAVFLEISNRGWDEAQFNHENAAILQSKLGRNWNNVARFSMYMFGAVEKANRATTIFAAYKQLKKNNPDMSHEALMDKAKLVSDRAHGIYGKTTLPAWARGQYNPLKLTYTFQKFSHNYILNMIGMGLKGKHAEAAYMMISPAILAGAGASMLTPIIASILPGDDPEEDMYKWAESFFGTDRYLRHGLAGTFGVNLKGSLQLNNPMPRNLQEVLGAPAAIYTDTARAMKYYRKGELYKGSEALLPTGIGSVLKAVREGTEGITTGSYSPVYDGNEVLKARPIEQIARALAFNPSRISGIRERQWREKVVAAKYARRKAELTEKLKRFYLYGKGDFDQLNQEWIKYNETIIGLKRPEYLNLMLTPRGLQSALIRALRPPRRERLKAAMAS